MNPEAIKGTLEFYTPVIIIIAIIIVAVVIYKKMKNRKNKR